jgi:hypothetical protein
MYVAGSGRHAKARATILTPLYDKNRPKKPVHGCAVGKKKAAL